MSDSLNSGNNAQANADSFYNGLRVQTSVDGTVIPVIFGTVRAAGNLIWAGAFSGGGTGGGKGGGKGVNENDYTVSLIMALCEGQIAGVGQTWVNRKLHKTVADAGFTIKNGSYPQTPWSYLTTNYPVQALPYPGIAYACAASYDIGVSPDLPSLNFEVRGLNIIGGSAQTMIDSTYIPLNTKPQITAANYTTYIADVGVTYTNGGPPGGFIATQAQWTAGSVAWYATYGTGPATPALLASCAAAAKAAMIAAGATYYANGVPAGTPLLKVTNFSPRSGLCGSGQYQVSSDGVYTFRTEDCNYAVQISYTYTVQDANPADIINAVITDSHFGLVPSFPLDFTGQGYRSWCIANGFYLSPAYTSQSPLSTVISDLLDQTFSTCIWHNANTLQFIPFGDVSVTGNGVTWNPNATPLYDLTDDDFLGDNSDDPIKVTRKTPAQADNDVKIEFFDRANQYNTAIVEAYDQGSEDTYLKRPAGTKSMHGICQSSIALVIAQLTLQRNLYIRNTYEFMLSGIKYGHLEPMDPVTLTDSNLGMNKYPVRITEIEEDENWDLKVTEEDFPTGVHNAALYSSITLGPYARDDNADPGNINTPIIFTAPGALTASGYEIWAAVSGGPNWGGCDVYVSLDGSTYSFFKRLYGPSRYGIVNYALPATADPDLSDTLQVDLSTSGAQLLSGTQADADNAITACMIDNEILSYKTATLVSGNIYNLTYLRRGQYFTTVASHALNANFLRLDNQIIKYPFTPAMIGTTLYFKFLSFNTIFLNQQTLAAVPAYSYTLTGSVTAPPNVTGFSATQAVGFVIFSWTTINNPVVVGYEIRYAPQGTGTWATAITITTVEAGTHLVSLKVPPGSWTFYIAAIDKSGNYSVTPASYNYTVQNQNTAVISLTDQALLGWPGTLTNMIVHPVSNVLLPKSNGAYTNNDWLWCTSFCINPYTTYSYSAPQTSLGSNQNLRAYANYAETLSPSGGNWVGGGTGTPDPTIELNYQPNGGAWTGFQQLSLANIYGQNFIFELIMTSLGSITSFIPVLDMAPITQSGSNVAVVTGGTTITFTTPFNNVPAVQITLLSAGSFSITQTNTGFTITGYTGYINWSATGT